MHFSKANIVDWLYMQGPVMRGNFTICPIIAQGDADAKAVADKLKIACN